MPAKGSARIQLVGADRMCAEASVIEAVVFQLPPQRSTAETSSPAEGLRAVAGLEAKAGWLAIKFRFTIDCNNQGVINRRQTMSGLMNATISPNNYSNTAYEHLNGTDHHSFTTAQSLGITAGIFATGTLAIAAGYAGVKAAQRYFRPTPATNGIPIAAWGSVTNAGLPSPLVSVVSPQAGPPQSPASLGFPPASPSLYGTPNSTAYNTPMATPYPARL
jgi:hypothetical protein